MKDQIRKLKLEQSTMAVQTTGVQLQKELEATIEQLRAQLQTKQLGGRSVSGDADGDEKH